MHYIFYRGLPVVARVDTRDAKVIKVEPKEGHNSLREYEGRPIAEMLQWARDHHVRWQVMQNKESQ